MNYIIIPAHENSRRLPGKALLNKTGKYLLQHTYESCLKSELADQVIIATDSTLIQMAAENFTAKVILTNEAKNGTERCYLASKYLHNPEIIVNCQLDFPEIDGKQIDHIFKFCKDQPHSIWTMGFDITSATKINTNIVKVVNDINKRVLYCSRACIPYGSQEFVYHIGVYGFNINLLRNIINIEKFYKNSEDLEQNNWLYAGFKMHILKYNGECFGINNIYDYNKFVKRVASEHVPSEQ